MPKAMNESNYIQLTVMEAGELLVEVFKYNREYTKDGIREHIVPELIGDPGIGKSAICKWAAKQVGNWFYSTSLTQMDPLVIAGIKFFDQEDRTMFTSQPEWVKTEPNGTVLIDEFAQATLMAKNIMGEPFNEHRMGPYQFHPTTTLMLASNKMTNKAGTSYTPSQIRDRVMSIYVTVSFDEWSVFAKKSGVRQEVINYLRFNQKDFNVFDPELDKNPTARSWTKVSEILDMELKGVIRTAAIQGQVGPGPATGFQSFLKVWESLPSKESILNDPRNAPIPDATKEPSALFALCGMLTRAADVKTAPAIMEYLKRKEMPAEFAIMTVKDFMDVNPKLGGVKAVGDWLAVNARDVLKEED